MKVKKIILSFDYEVFLHKSGTIENCIIKPVNFLLKTLEEIEAKGVFFIDILFLKKIKEQGIEDFDVLKENIQLLVKNGHQIGLHIHSHWKDAKYIESQKQWDLSNISNYRLQNLSLKESEELIFDGFNLLKLICCEVDENCNITSFRAGGLCLQPFNVFNNTLKKIGIKIDSSVAPGLSCSSQSHFYDYLNAPKKAHYLFDDDPIIENSSGYFKEYTISSFEKTLWDKISNKFTSSLKSKSKNLIFGDGKPSAPSGNTPKSSIWSKFKNDKYLFSLDEDLDVDLTISKLNKSHLELICFISHPKLMSDQAFVLLKKLKELNYEFVLMD